MVTFFELWKNKNKRIGGGEGEKGSEGSDDSDELVNNEYAGRIAVYIISYTKLQRVNLKTPMEFVISYRNATG